MKVLLNSAFSFFLSMLIVAMLVGCGSLTGQQNLKVGPPTPSSTNTAQSNDALRHGDTLDIRLSGVPGPEAGLYSEKVNEAGEISMPLVGKFKALGMSISDLKEQIETAYRKYYTTPNITILPQPRFVNIDGDVRSPQRVVYTEDMTLLVAINSCGGFSDFADQRNIKVIRANKVIRCDAKAARTHPELDLRLQPGDLVKVERSIF